jgi:hypothetical protein
MNDNNKKYEPFRIPGQLSMFQKEDAQTTHKTGNGVSISLEDQGFIEIEIDDNISYKSNRSIPIPQSIEPVIDEKRKLYHSMRQIANDSRSFYSSSPKFYNTQVQHDNSRIFYKQALLMQNFEDDYTGNAPFSSYFPYYQMMSYEQFRTYFTWRTHVRKGDVYNTSLSYAFVYIYELLQNIGVEDPQDGLNELMFFWKEFKVYDSTINKYIIKWIKDYHIYYQLPKSLKEFISENHMSKYYPEVFEYETNANDLFDLLSSVSKYNIKQSKFYNDETRKIVIDCFNYVIHKLKLIFKTLDLNFYDTIFQPTKNLAAWTPFKGALFFPMLKGPDRRVVLSEKEIYIFRQNKWLFSTVITAENGRQLIGYIMKQMESALRNLMKYKPKLSANINAIDNTLNQKLCESGLSFEKAINNAVLEYYNELNKTIISVNEVHLSRIRMEALDTQEKLTVPEDVTQITSVTPPAELLINKPNEIPSVPSLGREAVLVDGWTSFKDALTQMEINAITSIIQGAINMKQFADENNIMLEVLADSINEKAVDYIGDNILELDDSMTIYDEYRDKIMKMVGIV